MSDKFTCRAFQFGKAPARIKLVGDKRRSPEPAQHIIEFPGGAIEVTRTTEGDYWAHILINRDWACEDLPGLREVMGGVKDSRIDRGGAGIESLSDAGAVRQIAVLIGREHA